MESKLFVAKEFLDATKFFEAVETEDRVLFVGSDRSEAVGRVSAFCRFGQNLNYVGEIFLALGVVRLYSSYSELEGAPFQKIEREVHTVRGVCFVRRELSGPTLTGHPEESRISRNERHQLIS